uniref:5.3 kDa nonstructural protein n=1 Tax=Equine coronavirus (isolate NC99) TaxID=202496 RepID=Q6W354_CVEN9|nr:5.3 kDa nonstructural protein [Equine coronavirus NC99]
MTINFVILTILYDLPCGLNLLQPLMGVLILILVQLYIGLFRHFYMC